MHQDEKLQKQANRKGAGIKKAGMKPFLFYFYPIKYFMSRCIIPSVLLLIALVASTTLTYAQTFVATSAYTGHPVNIHGYQWDRSPAWVYPADSIKKHNRRIGFFNSDDGSDIAVRGFAGGAILSAIGGILMLANQHDQNSSGLQDGAGCTVMGGCFVVCSVWGYLIVKIANRHHGFSLAAKKNRVGIAYNF